MLRLAIVFLVIALIAALLGFGGVAALSWEGAKILFVVFLILAVLSFLGQESREKSVRVIKESCDESYHRAAESIFRTR